LGRAAGQGAVIVEGVAVSVDGNALANVGTVAACSAVGVCADIPTVLQGLTGVDADLFLCLVEIPVPGLVGGGVAEALKRALVCAEEALRDLRDGTAWNGRRIHPATTDLSGGVLTGYEAVNRSGETGLLKLLKGRRRTGGPEQTLWLGNDVDRRARHGIHILKGGSKSLRRRIGALRRNDIG